MFSALKLNFFNYFTNFTQGTVFGVLGVFFGIDKHDFFLVHMIPNQSPALTSLGTVTSEV